MDNYLRWNAPNWITVVLMVATASVAFGLVASVFKGRAG